MFRYARAGQQLPDKVCHTRGAGLRPVTRSAAGVRPQGDRSGTPGCAGRSAGRATAPALWGM